MTRRPRRGVVSTIVLSLSVAFAGCATSHKVSTQATTPTAEAMTTTSEEETTTTSTLAPSTTTTTVAPSTTAVPRAASTGLQGAVDAATASSRVATSVVAVDLARGERGSHLGARVVLSASLYKLFVARELFRRIGEGSVQRDQPSGDGAHNVDECLRLMIVVSDDGCGVAGLSMVGRGALNPALRRDGFTGTALDSPQRTTANDVAELIRREREAETELYRLMREQQVNDRMPPSLPPNTVIAHKTGDRTGWAHDAGVIGTARGELIVVVLTGPWPSPCCHEERIGPLEREAFSLIGGIARRIYDWATTAT